MVKSILSLKNNMPADSSDALAVALCHFNSLQNFFVKSSSAKSGNSWKTFTQNNPGRIISKKVK